MLSAAEVSGVGGTVQAQLQAAQLGQTVLLTQLASEYLALPHLPYKTVFQGSHSLLWHPSKHRALVLHPASSTPSDWQQACQEPPVRYARYTRYLIERHTRYTHYTRYTHTRL